MAKEQAERSANFDLGVIPFILSPDGKKHVEWMKLVFDASENTMYKDEATGKIVYASLSVNGGVVYLSDGSCIPEQKVGLHVLAQVNCLSIPLVRADGNSYFIIKAILSLLLLQSFSGCLSKLQIYNYHNSKQQCKLKLINECTRPSPIRALQ